MHLVDLLLLVFLAVVFPVTGAMTYRRYIRKIEAGEKPDRIGQYQSTFLVEWGLFAVLAGIWVVMSREPGDLGLTTPSGLGEIAGGVLVGGLALFLVWSRIKASRATASEREAYRTGLGTIQYFLPSNRRELRVFYALSVTAGIVEELIYRGYFFWLFALYMPVWAVVLLSSFIFALGHTYQGISGMIQVFLVGLAFGGLYLLTGTIWIPIIAHAMLDILQGRVLYEYMRQREDEPPANAAPAA
ncbi:MAG: CPBP family intramembrane metalloprotease [Rhodothermales bacterium]|nr:CPBP family intramembrane metalloprotease [Rhodothermales bacterium]